MQPVDAGRRGRPPRCRRGRRRRGPRARRAPRTGEGGAPTPVPAAEERDVLVVVMGSTSGRWRESLAVPWRTPWTRAQWPPSPREAAHRGTPARPTNPRCHWSCDQSPGRGSDHTTSDMRRGRVGCWGSGVLRVCFACCDADWAHVRTCGSLARGARRPADAPGGLPPAGAHGHARRTSPCSRWPGACCPTSGRRRLRTPTVSPCSWCPASSRATSPSSRWPRSCGATATGPRSRGSRPTSPAPGSWPTPSSRGSSRSPSAPVRRVAIVGWSRGGRPGQDRHGPPPRPGLGARHPRDSQHRPARRQRDPRGAAVGDHPAVSALGVPGCSATTASRATAPRRSGAGSQPTSPRRSPTRPCSRWTTASSTGAPASTPAPTQVEVHATHMWMGADPEVIELVGDLLGELTPVDLAA